jgi:hypothetical protein
MLFLALNIADNENLYAGVGAPLLTTGGPTSCVGDTVTFTCTVGGIAHLWRIAQPGSNVITAPLARAHPTFPAPGGAPSPFMITIATDDTVNNVIISVLTVTSFAGLNGADISCTDANVANVEPQETTVSVFGECCYDYRGMCTTKVNVV